jgi:hypothetical protein
MPARRDWGWHDQQAIIVRRANLPRAILGNNGAGFANDLPAAKIPQEHEIM